MRPPPESPKNQEISVFHSLRIHLLDDARIALEVYEKGSLNWDSGKKDPEYYRLNKEKGLWDKSHFSGQFLINNIALLLESKVLLDQISVRESEAEIIAETTKEEKEMERWSASIDPPLTTVSSRLLAFASKAIKNGLTSEIYQLYADHYSTRQILAMWQDSPPFTAELANDFGEGEIFGDPNNWAIWKFFIIKGLRASDIYNLREHFSDLDGKSVEEIINDLFRYYVINDDRPFNLAAVLAVPGDLRLDIALEIESIQNKVKDLGSTRPPVQDSAVTEEPVSVTELSQPVSELDSSSETRDCERSLFELKLEKIRAVGKIIASKVGWYSKGAVLQPNQARVILAANSEHELPDLEQLGEYDDEYISFYEAWLLLQNGVTAGYAKTLLSQEFRDLSNNPEIYTYEERRGVFYRIVELSKLGITREFLLAIPESQRSEDAIRILLEQQERADLLNLLHVYSEIPGEFKEHFPWASIADTVYLYEYISTNPNIDLEKIVEYRAVFENDELNSGFNPHYDPTTESFVTVKLPVSGKSLNISAFTLHIFETFIPRGIGGSQLAQDALEMMRSYVSRGRMSLNIDYLRYWYMFGFNEDNPGYIDQVNVCGAVDLHSDPRFQGSLRDAYRYTSCLYSAGKDANILYQRLGIDPEVFKLNPKDCLVEGVNKGLNRSAAIIYAFLHGAQNLNASLVKDKVKKVITDS